MNTLTEALDTVLRNEIPPDAMLGDDEITEVATALAIAAHRHITLCGLTREDFDPEEGPCIDGGMPSEHPVSTV